VRPCPYGASVSDTNPACVFLEPVEQSPGLHPRYVCGIYDEIVRMPGSEICPAFGGGCSSPLFNTDRAAILRDLVVDVSVEDSSGD